MDLKRSCVLKASLKSFMNETTKRWLGESRSTQCNVVTSVFLHGNRIKNHKPIYIENFLSYLLQVTEKKKTPDLLPPSWPLRKESKPNPLSTWLANVTRNTAQDLSWQISRQQWRFLSQSSHLISFLTESWETKLYVFHEYSCIWLYEKSHFKFMFVFLLKWINISYSQLLQPDFCPFLCVFIH